jgi:branched-chain amino acid transport system ATP-binding protein
VRTWQSLELFDELTVRQNVMVGAEPATVLGVALDVVHPNRSGHIEQVEWALELLGLAGDGDKRPSELPLGRQKLVGVARAVGMAPSVLLLDEPAAGLDPSESAAFGARLHDIVGAGIAVLLVDHDMGLVLDVCDDLYVIEFGRLIAHGPPSQIRHDPAVIAAYLGETAQSDTHRIDIESAQTQVKQ